MKKQPVEKEGISADESVQQFSRMLLSWNQCHNHRQMPWKGEKDPYKIWLSEVILQQTRVEQGLKYYQQFTASFPTVQALAAAPDEIVFKLWEGLGYYSRCRNLLQAARFIANDLHGVFPATYDAILALKGVGSYTAAAIASFAYNLPYAVLDGNVFRVLSRLFANETPVDSAKGKKVFSALAEQLLPRQRAGEYNQALMDFGATICKPAPLCHSCFFNRHCRAYLGGQQLILPVKDKKITLKKRWLNYFVVQCGKNVLVQQRGGKDIWQGLYQFFLLETGKAIPATALQQLFEQEAGINNFVGVEEWKSKQALSHQHICFHFFYGHVKRQKKVEGYQWMPIDKMRQLAFPKTLHRAVEVVAAGNRQVEK